MSQRQVAFVVGSLRRDSFNRQLLAATIALAPAELRFTELKIDDLPPYNQDDDERQCAQVVRLKSAIKAADALLFATPEYNRSVPGVLKNALDHASRPYGQNAWAQKPAGIISASIAAAGGAMAQQHLRNILAYLDAPVFAQPEAYLQITPGFFDLNGALTKEDSRKFLQNWMARYAEWLQRMLR